MSFTSGVSFAANEVPTASKLTSLGANDDALASGSALATNAVTGDKLAVTAIKLGYAAITSGVSTTSSTVVQAIGLSATVTVPLGGRSVKVTAYCYALTNSATAYALMSLWQGAVGSGTQIGGANAQMAVANQSIPATAIAVVTPASGTVTFNVGLAAAGGGTASINAAAAAPALLLVELI